MRFVQEDIAVVIVEIGFCKNSRPKLVMLSDAWPPRHVGGEITRAASISNSAKTIGQNRTKPARSSNAGIIRGVG